MTKRIQDALAEFNQNSHLYGGQNEERNKECSKELMEIIIIKLLQERNIKMPRRMWNMAQSEASNMTKNRCQPWANIIQILVRELSLDKKEKNTFMDNIIHKIHDLRTGNDLKDEIVFESASYNYTDFLQGKAPPEIEYPIVDPPDLDLEKTTIKKEKAKKRITPTLLS
jgi:hypothetical protein